jgi:cytochrome P450
LNFNRKPFTSLALDVLSTSVFGFESRALNPIKIEDYKAGEIPSNVSMTMVDSLMNVIQGLAINLFLSKKIARMIPFGFFKKSSKSVDDFVSYGKFILEKSRNKKDGDDTQDGLVQMMLKAQDGEGTIKLTDEELISNMFIFFFAGHETTAGTLHWAMLELCKNPKVQEKFFHEVNEVLGGRNPTYEDLPNLKYAFGVFKETLRTHPPVKGIFKKSIEKVTLNGHEFPKDTNFGIFTPAVHRDKEIWENPLEFQPERYMKNTNYSHLMSFSFGKRNCIGSRFAEIEGTVILCILIQKFSIQFKEGIDPSLYAHERNFITSTPKNDLPFVLKKR